MNKIILLISISSFVAFTNAACDFSLSKTIQCENCNEFNICVGQSSTLVACPSTQRYCTRGIANDFCTSTLQPGNVNCDNLFRDFKCTRPGYFPNPYNCAKYFECFNVDVGGGVIELIFYEKSCPDKQYYNSKQKKCLAYVASQCHTVSCSNVNIGFAAYTVDTQYYHFCDENQAAGEVLMFRCDDNETFINGHGCRYRCAGIGRYPHEDKRKYYECKSVGTDNYDIGICYSGVFDPVTKKCIFGY